MATVSFDPEADAAYIRLAAPEPGQSRQQCAANCPGLRGSVVLDLDWEGRLIGIEILGAGDALTAETLSDASGPREATPAADQRRASPHAAAEMTTERSLTTEEAFTAMFRFLDRYWHEIPSAVLGQVLGDIQPMGGRPSADPAAWEDWVACVDQVLNDHR